ncbi:MAG: SIR2 family protein [Clostridia bacterium]|nr:SIR2 family protein [Clostridia bacterium]
MKLSDLINYKNNYPKLKFIQEHRSDIIPFIGAGISIECGLYSWREMLDSIAKDYFTDAEICNIHETCDYYSYADKIVKVTGNAHMVMKKISDLFNQASIKITDSPYILTTSFSKLIVTTNYDTILETVSRQSIKDEPLKPLLPCLKGQVDEAIQSNERCLLKLHGSTEETTSFILTSKQYQDFYGKPSERSGKPLPLYLEQLFSGKKLLFVGCSLEMDKTLEILRECVTKYKTISHYAIVPWITDDEKRLQRARQLTSLGIEPIFYPEGDFDSVNKLLRFLAKENPFTTQVETALKELINNDKILDEFVAVVKDSFYDTAKEFPELLDDIFMPSEDAFSKMIKNKMNTLCDDDDLYKIVLFVFKAYISCGCFYAKDDIVKCFEDIYSDLCLRESKLMGIFEKNWSIKKHTDVLTKDISWVKNLSLKNINENAQALLDKLQYRNGMSFSDIQHYYNSAKEFESLVGDKLDYHIHTRLLNSIGAFSYYYNESEIGIAHLEKAITLVLNNEEQKRPEQLFLAKCYYNLALAYVTSGNIMDALLSIRKDIELKEKFDEHPQIYARSCDLYATILKNIEPFHAGRIYVEAAKIKAKYIVLDKDGNNSHEDMLASWATALFNIGLLARDIGLNHIAYDYILIANEIRSKTLDKCNRDFCSSLNVQSELELMLHLKDNPISIITTIESKQALPEGYSKIMGHTFYVCALYYFTKKDFISAFDYANKSLIELKNENSSDLIQVIKSRLISLLSLQTIKQNGQALKYSLPNDIFKDIIEDIEKLLGTNSFYLSYPYQALIYNSTNSQVKEQYSNKYHKLIDDFSEEMEDLLDVFIKYLAEIQQMIC